MGMSVKRAGGPRQEHSMKALPSSNCRYWTPLGNRRARVASGPGPFPKEAPWKLSPQTLVLGVHPGLGMGSRTVIHQGIHLCTLQPQASLVVTKKYAQ